jgi:membrane associated rhomboid family serine protease
VSSTGSRTPRIPRGSWTISDEEAQSLLRNARRAFFVMVGVLALLWIIQVINAATGYRLSDTYGVQAHDVSSLPHILTAPFLHLSWHHIEGNSGPLFIFGFLAAYRGLGKFAALTVIVVLTSGFAAWFFSSTGTTEAGASGVIFGYFGYIIVRGIFDRRGFDVLVGAVMVLCFAYDFSVLIPQAGLSWQAHIGGLVGGVLAGWLLRDKRAVVKARKEARAATAAVQPGPSKRAASAPAAGTVALPGSKPGQPGQSGKKGFAADPSNPRADLHKQLDDLGL